jgi:hypothetical protein
VRSLLHWTILAVAAIAVSALAALPYDAELAAGIAILFGFYFVLPVAAMLGLAAYTERLPAMKWIARGIAALVAPVGALWLAYLTVFLGPHGWLAGAISVVVVIAAGVRLWRASTSGGAAGGAAAGRYGATGGG